jgi:hypothetical protein
MKNVWVLRLDDYAEAPSYHDVFVFRRQDHALGRAADLIAERRGEDDDAEPSDAAKAHLANLLQHGEVYDNDGGWVLSLTEEPVLKGPY